MIFSICRGRTRFAAWLVAGCLAVLTDLWSLPGRALEAEQWKVFETTRTSARHYANPFLDVQVEVVFRTGNEQRTVPVLVGETCYEGHMQQGFGDVQRRIFWMNVLSGAAGHTYGAAGVWHAGVKGDPGHSGAWAGQVYDWTTWEEGMRYPGSGQLGLGKQLLEKCPWWRFEPHPEWAPGCFAAGVTGEVRFVYQPRRSIYNWDGFAVVGLEPDIDWHAYYVDPATGRTFDQGIIKATAKPGDKTAGPVTFKKNVPSPQDWVLVLERVNSGTGRGKAEREASMSGSRAVPACGKGNYE